MATARLTLLEDPRGGAAGNGGTPVRRYRLARLRVETSATDSDERFEYLRRPHD